MTNDPRPYKLRSIFPIEGLDQTLDPYQDWPQRPLNHPNDVILWPCGTWCYREELADFTHKSDDYEQIPAGSLRARDIEAGGATQ